MGVRRCRRLLQLLTVLSAVGGGAICFFGFYLSISKASVTAYALEVVGALVVINSLLGLGGVTANKTSLLMLYFYSNIMLQMALIVLSYMAFFAHDTLAMWIKLNWDSVAFEPLRRQSCCETYEATLLFMQKQFMLMGSIGFGLIGGIILAMYLVVQIVTIPIVMRHMLTVINLIFILLGAATAIYGFYMEHHEVMDAGQHWIAYVFISIGILVFGLSVIGIIGSRAKSRSLLFMYATGLFICLIVLMSSTICAFSFAQNLAQTYQTSHIGELACAAHLSECTNCTGNVLCQGAYRTSSGYWETCSSQIYNTTVCHQDKTVILHGADQGYEANDIAYCGKCPEWNESDINAYIKSSLYLAGVLSLMMFCILGVAFCGAVILRKSLKGYQTESI